MFLRNLIRLACYSKCNLYDKLGEPDHNLQHKIVIVIVNEPKNKKKNTGRTITGAEPRNHYGVLIEM